MDKPSDWVVFTQRLGYCPEGWVKHLTQLLVENKPACVLSNILFLTQHFLECNLALQRWDCACHNAAFYLSKWKMVWSFITSQIFFDGKECISQACIRSWITTSPETIQPEPRKHPEISIHIKHWKVSEIWECLSFLHSFIVCVNLLYVH